MFESLTADEDAISEILCSILNRVCYNLSRSRNQELQTPYWEAPIQPVTDKELKGGKKRKRPDFTCKCINPWAKSHEKYEISLHIECKLLGSPTSPSWILNENYVKNGINRFDCERHGYGKRACAGMMIGYIVSMTPERIESEVNKYLKKHKPDYMKIDFLFDKSSTFKSFQDIERKIVSPTNFKLIHHWVDLRKCMKRAVGSL
jgi:hypothetical protein